MGMSNASDVVVIAHLGTIASLVVPRGSSILHCCRNGKSVGNFRITFAGVNNMIGSQPGAGTPASCHWAALSRRKA